jgi:chaperonin GroES
MLSSDGYEEVSLGQAKMLGDRILCRWEEATEEYGRTGLQRPHQYRKSHFTGIVIACGPEVSQDLVKIVEKNRESGEETRIAFDQFSRFDKFSDPVHGRVAILAEVAQADCLAVVPLRGELTLNGIKPIGPRVLLRPEAREWEQRGSLTVPGEKKVEVQRGEIIATGVHDSIEVVPGDIVLYEKYAGVEFPLEGIEYILLEFRKVAGIVEQNQEAANA